MDAYGYARLGLAAAAVIGAGAAAYGIYKWLDDEDLTEGTVVDKKHEPAHTSTTWIPIQTGSIPMSGGGSVPIYTPFPFTVHDDEDWKLKLREGEGKDARTEWVDVSKTDYQRYDVGEFFDADPVGDSNSQERISKEEAARRGVPEPAK